jgi:hypothetical protein
MRILLVMGFVTFSQNMYLVCLTEDVRLCSYRHGAVGNTRSCVSQ